MNSKDYKLFSTGNANDMAIHGSTRGWFVGHFIKPEDSPTNTSYVELKWGSHKAGEEKSSIAVNHVATTLTLLISGKFELIFHSEEGQIMESIVLKTMGDYALSTRGTYHSWKAVEDSVVLTVRWPSLPHDQVKVDEDSSTRKIGPSIPPSIGLVK